MYVYIYNYIYVYYKLVVLPLCPLSFLPSYVLSAAFQDRNGLQRSQSKGNVETSKPQNPQKIACWKTLFKKHGTCWTGGFQWINGNNVGKINATNNP